MARWFKTAILTSLTWCQRVHRAVGTECLWNLSDIYFEPVYGRKITFLKEPVHFKDTVIKTSRRYAAQEKR